MRSTLWSLHDVVASATNESECYRFALGAYDESTAADDDDVARWLSAEPRPSGSRRADALVAAVAEHVAFQRGLKPPKWVEAPERFLETAWYPVDLPSIRVRARVHSPASFARRLIFIDRRDLYRV